MQLPNGSAEAPHVAACAHRPATNAARRSRCAGQPQGECCYQQEGQCSTACIIGRLLDKQLSMAQCDTMCFGLICYARVSPALLQRPISVGTVARSLGSFECMDLRIVQVCEPL